METIVDIIKFIWQDEVTFWGLSLYFVSYVGKSLTIVNVMNTIVGVDD